VNKGDISINTLVAVVIGIIVVAVVAYLMFFYSKESSLDCRLCGSRFAGWCQECLAVEENWKSTLSKGSWTEPLPMSDDLNNCKETCLGITFDDCAHSDAIKECKKYIYIPPTTTTT
jgi:hypothetical protein